VDYLLHDQPVRFLKGKLRLRQVTRLCDDGHQTQVITSRWDLRDIEVAYRMFERWRPAVAVAAPSDPERLLGRALDLPNAVWRFQGVSATYTRCLMLAFRARLVQIRRKRQERVHRHGDDWGAGQLCRAVVLRRDHRAKLDDLRHNYALRVPSSGFRLWTFMCRCSASRW
jgi:hypothetical protein